MKNPLLLTIKEHLSMGRKSKAEVRKKEILEYFYTILKEEGFENTSIAKIAKRMEVNPSLLIHYFKTKDEMVVAFVEHLLGRYEDRIREQLSEPNSPSKQLEDTLDILFSENWLNFSDATVFYSCYYLSSRNERIRDRFREFYQMFRALLLPQVEHWIEMGIIQGQDPKRVVEYLIIMNEGLTYYDKLMQDVDGFRARARYLKQSAWIALTQVSD